MTPSADARHVHVAIAGAKDARNLAGLKFEFEQRGMPAVERNKAHIFAIG